MEEDTQIHTMPSLTMNTDTEALLVQWDREMSLKTNRGSLPRLRTRRAKTSNTETIEAESHITDRHALPLTPTPPP